MPNPNPTKSYASRARQWDNPEDQRAAGRDFLQAVLADDQLRKDVVADHKTARAKLKEKGQIPVPDEVEVICVESNIPERKRTVVFVLPEKGSVLQSDLAVLNYWVAAWTPYSSQRFKRNIQTMGDASSGLLALRPVTFRYKPEYGPEDAPQFGLVAEEVEKTDPDLVVRDDAGQAYGVRYDAINAMLLNEFLKQHSRVEQQELRIAEQRKELNILAAKVERMNAA